MTFWEKGTMSELKSLFVALKRQLKARGWSYRDVAVGLGVSEPSVKRLFSTGRISLERLIQICTLLDLTLAELTQEAAMRTPKLQGLNDKQEADLVADPERLLVAVCVLNHWTANEISAHYRIEEASCVSHLLHLDRMRLIDLLPGNRIRINVARDFDWLPNGPIRRYFRDRGQDDFLSGDFAGEGEASLFLHGMLTLEAKAQLLVLMRRLRRSFDTLHDESLQAPLDQRHGTGLLLAVRQWEAPDFVRLKRPQT
jgi:transcriptional regulator with XRE-family HTH domain